MTCRQLIIAYAPTSGEREKPFAQASGKANVQLFIFVHMCIYTDVYILNGRMLGCFQDCGTKTKLPQMHLPSSTSDPPIFGSFHARASCPPQPGCKKYSSEYRRMK